jgi:hydrogenase-4 membrane subunit HyfE
MIRIFLWPKLLRLETKHHEQLSYGKIKISSKLILTGIMLIIFSFIFANEYLAENIADGNHLSDTAKESMLSAHKTNKRINIDHSKAVLPIKKVNIDSIMIYLGVCIILLGMFVMITRSDILAQAVGLIQAENGLYLTAFVLIKNCQKQSIVVQFAIATFVFVLLTFVTLYFILRYAYEQKRTYNMNKFKELKG